MPRGKPRHAGGAAGPVHRGPRRLPSRPAVIAGALVVAGLGAWIVRRGRGGVSEAQSAVPQRAPERAARPAPAAAPLREPRAAALAGASVPGEPKRSPGSSQRRSRRSRRSRRLARWLPATVGALLVLALAA